MADHQQAEATAEERIPAVQFFFDDVFLILTLGLAVPFVLYIGWGLIEVVQLPVFRP